MGASFAFYPPCWSWGPCTSQCSWVTDTQRSQEWEGRSFPYKPEARCQMNWGLSVNESFQHHLSHHFKIFDQFGTRKLLNIQRPPHRLDLRLSLTLKSSQEFVNPPLKVWTSELGGSGFQFQYYFSLYIIVTPFQAFGPLPWKGVSKCIAQCDIKFSQGLNKAWSPASNDDCRGKFPSSIFTVHANCPLFGMRLDCEETTGSDWGFTRTSWRHPLGTTTSQPCGVPAFHFTFLEMSGRHLGWTEHPFFGHLSLQQHLLRSLVWEEVIY